MKFIHVSKVIDQLYMRPELLEDRYIDLVLRMMKLDLYRSYSLLKILLAYTIIKHDYPRSPISIHSGIHENTGMDRNTIYLQISPDTDTFIGNIPVDQTTIISDLTDGYLIMVDDPINTAYKLLEHQSLPLSKGEVMRWLRRERLVDDDNAREISSVIDRLLQPGSNFYQDIPIMNLWEGRTLYIDSYNDLLTRSILAIKMLKGINIILGKYPLTM